MADVREDAMRRGNEMDVNLNIQGGASQGITGNNSNSFGGKQQKTLTEQLKKMAGIDIGVGALLKQSQIFTGFLGNLFAIVGALIDTVLAPLAPSAFKALGHLGKIIPRIGEVASKWIPKIEGWVGGIVTKIDRFFKRFDPSWAKKALWILGSILATNMAMKMILMTGKMGASVLGLRQGGILNMAGRGGMGLGKSIATRGVGGTLAAGGSALMGAGALRGFGGGGGTPSTVPTGATVSQTAANTGGLVDVHGNPLSSKTKPPTVPQGTIKGGASRLGRLGGIRAMGRVPIIGGVVSGVTGYMGGREQGMSQGTSMARGGTIAAATAGGAWAGAKGGAMLGGAIGSAFGGIGAVPGAAIGGLAGGVSGGAAGYWGASGGFDALFGKKGKGGGGGGAYNMDIGGSSGAAGYRAPLFVAEAAEFWSEQVRKDGAVLDDHTIEVELSKRKIAEEAAAREKATGDWATYLDGLTGTHTGLTSMEKGSMDDPDDIGSGSATIEHGLFRNPEVIAAEKAAEEAANEAARKANEEFMKQQRIANDKMVAEDQAQADDAHAQFLRDQQAKREVEQAEADLAAAELAKQFQANDKLKGQTSTDLLSGEGVYADAIRNDPSALNILLQTDSTDATEKIFVARTIGNKTYQAQVYSGEDPWR